VAVRSDSAGGAHVRETAHPQLIEPYPFTAIVGQDRLKQALLLNAVNPAVGGVLLEGTSGTGKSTAVRGLAELLPEIGVVADCPFSCDPSEPCASCRTRHERGEELASARRRVRVVTLPLNATEDRVAGSVDMARALREGIASLEPGLLAEANRGVLYVDEINLLDDHLCDILLDAAALGTNVVERESVSVSHPARFLLVGTMNPEEGELRPQLADRIGLRVVVDAIIDPAGRAEVMRRREAYTAGAQAFAASFSEQQAELARTLEAARTRLGGVTVPHGVYAAIAQVVVRTGVKSHRADVTILEGAKAQAALEARDFVSADDVFSVATAALPHRLALDPFDAQAGLDERILRRVLDEVLEVSGDEKKASGRVTPAPTTT
jgi:Mg-chelatase subunit ChlI